MRSAAKLSYEQAQDAIDGRPDDATGPLLECVLKPLWAAYAAMKIGRDARSPLAIESLERRIVLGPDGKVVSITPRASLEAHKLIEEMMIQANVCAAETLEQTRLAADLPGPRRAQPGEAASTWPTSWPPSACPGPRASRRAPTASTSCWSRRARARMRRSSTRWSCAPRCRRIYTTENIGHFGLQPGPLRPLHLADPPLRRPDRAPRPDPALGLGDDGLTDYDVARLKDTAEHITAGRAARHGRRARRHRPLRRRLSGRPRRRGRSRAASPGSPASACSCA